jgi:hypothetical protein
MNQDQLKQYVKNIIEKAKLFFGNLKLKIYSKLPKKNKQPTEKQTDEAQAKENKPSKKLKFDKILIGITIGFVFGALISSIMLYFKIKKIQNQYIQTQAKLLMISNQLKTYKMQASEQKQSASQQSSDLQALVIGTINTLPSSNAFASFYVNKLNEKKELLKRERLMVKKEQALKTKSVEAQTHHKKPPSLPPLKTLLANSKGQGAQNSNPSVPPPSPPPPLPNISMIICQSMCYAISSNGQTYTNGFTEGDYKLVVTPNQVYWVKASK